MTKCPAMDVFDGSIPQGCVGTPQDAADTCLWFRPDLTVYVCGQVISVDVVLYQRGSGPLGQRLGGMLSAGWED